MDEFKKGLRGFVIGTIPGQKKLSLFVRNKNQVSKIATFKDEESADTFRMYMQFFMENPSEQSDEIVR